MSLSRLRTNFRFAILTLFGAVGVLGVTPFALYRFVHGQVLIGLVDLGIVACIAACLAYVWRGGNLERASWFVVATYNLGCLMIAGLIGLSGVLWMYPVLLANFLLVDRWIAIGVSAVGIAAVLLLPDVFASGLQLALFLITAVITCLFTFIFAARGDSQRARLEALARLDPLTQAFNRRALERELQLALESHRRRQGSFGLAVLDLDHFKRVNDTFGHEAGDRVLVEFTRLVGAVTRKGDRLFRSGGEEFVLLLPGAGVAELQIVCEHVRARVAAGLACDGQSITVSIGAAALVTGEDALSWLGRADAAMYRAKNAGRNAVVVDAAGDSPTMAPATAR
jgi:diguanylate cyclase (GGDEF)-like protein